MHEHQQNHRLAAEKAFKESLDQLQNILAQECQTAEIESQGESEQSSTSWADPKVLEEAAADLEEFFGDEDLLEEGALDEET